jgi:hypothetical protein
MGRQNALACALALIWAPAFVAAHEGHGHKAMGTVTAVRADKSEIEIKTTEAKTLVLTVAPATRFKKGTAAAALRDVEVGLRVAVVYEQKGQALQASEVMIGVAAPGVPHKP